MAKCSGCGASLSLTGGPVVRCAYCGTDNRVAPDPVPVKVMPPPVIVVQPPSVPSGGGGMVGRWLVAGIVLPLAITGAVISSMHKSNKLREAVKQAVSNATNSVESIGKITWRSNSLCFVDGNGDGALDPVGFGSRGGPSERVVALDLLTGVDLWKSAPFSSGARDHCGDRGTILVTEDDFTLTALDGRTGKRRWQAHLSDKARDVAVQSDCVAVRTDDNQHHGFALATGAPQKCSPAKSHHHGFGESPSRTTVRSGDLEVDLTVKRPGTPVLILAGRRGDHPLWKTTLSAQEMTSDKRFVFASGGKVMVFGGAMPSNAHLVIIGVDAATGQVAYTQNEMSAFSSSIFFNDARLEGPYVVATFGSEIHAYDPATGNPVW